MRRIQFNISFQNIYGGYIGNSPQILLLGNGFCVMMVALLGHDNKDGIITKVFNIGCILCGIATAIMYATRFFQSYPFDFAKSVMNNI